MKFLLQRFINVVIREKYVKMYFKFIIITHLNKLKIQHIIFIRNSSLTQTHTIVYFFKITIALYKQYNEIIWIYRGFRSQMIYDAKSSTITYPLLMFAYS